MNQQQRYKVMLDAGHGGNDPGATGGGLREKDINLYVSLKVRDILEKAGVTVFMSRTTDTTVSLPARTRDANQKRDDILLSIHVNAAANTSAKGYETFHYPGSSKGKALATAIHKEVIDAKIYNSNRGVKSANFHMLRESNMPAVLVEFAFISNAQDRVLLTNKKDEFAEALAKGLLNYLGVKPNVDKIVDEVVTKGDAQDMTKDYENHWAKESIDKVVELGLMQGSDDGNFYPNKELTRGEFATALVRLIEQADLNIKK